jgi:hypothetical protein
MRIQTNIGQVTRAIAEKLKVLKDPEYLLRPVAFGLIDKMTQRIHIDGKASDDGRIGTYSFGYMQVRLGIFGNSEEVAKGENKGKIKNSGVVSRGKNKGQPRPKYNRTSDTKIIVSLTRQLENDWSVIATQKGYGIGFKNEFNLQKLRWVEQGRGKKIGDLTTDEQKYVVDYLNELTADALNT